MIVDVYSALPGFPSRAKQPAYYETLAGAGRFGERPGAKVLVAVSGQQLLGGVVYLGDLAQYGVGVVAQEHSASGMRLLGVAPEARGLGVGTALTNACIARARLHDHKQVILHTMPSMRSAWRLYEHLGFRRSPDLDFVQEAVQVFGFRYLLA